MSGVKPIINTLSRAYILPDDKGFAPPIICIDFREYEAMKSELIELRAFKVNHSATFDAPTEYEKPSKHPDWFPKDINELDLFCYEYSEFKSKRKQEQGVYDFYNSEHLREFVKSYLEKK